MVRTALCGGHDGPTAIPTPPQQQTSGNDPLAAAKRRAALKKMLEPASGKDRCPLLRRRLPALSRQHKLRFRFDHPLRAPNRPRCQSTKTRRDDLGHSSHPLPHPYLIESPIRVDPNDGVLFAMDRDRPPVDEPSVNRGEPYTLPRKFRQRPPAVVQRPVAPHRKPVHPPGTVEIYVAHRRTHYQHPPEAFTALSSTTSTNRCISEAGKRQCRRSARFLDRNRRARFLVSPTNRLRSFPSDRATTNSRMSASSDPKNPREWQEAVDAAQFTLLVDAANQYGLIEGCPSINVERCEEILSRGAELGYEPAPTRALLERSVDPNANAQREPRERMRRGKSGMR